MPFFDSTSPTSGKAKSLGGGGHLLQNQCRLKTSCTSSMCNPLHSGNKNIVKNMPNETMPAKNIKTLHHHLNFLKTDISATS